MKFRKPVQVVAGLALMLFAVGLVRAGMRDRYTAHQVFLQVWAGVFLFSAGYFTMRMPQHKNWERQWIKINPNPIPLTPKAIRNIHIIFGNFFLFSSGARYALGLTVIVSVMFTACIVMLSRRIIRESDLYRSTSEMQSHG